MSYLQDIYYPGGNRGQNVNAYEVENYVDAIQRMSYESEDMSADYIGDEIFGADDLQLGNMDLRQKREIMAYTGLVGAADFFNDAQLRRDYSEATFYTGTMTISGMASMGKTFGYPIEETEMMRPSEMRFALQLAGELPMLLKETEEWHDVNFWNDADTTLGGWYSTPVFVDGSTHKLQLLDRPNYFAGTLASNIVSFVGGIIGAIKYADSYGDNFINEEGRRERKYVTHIICGEQVGDKLETYYGANFDIENMLPWMPNQRNQSRNRRVVPTILRTVKLDNPTDIIFLYNGWQEQFKKFVYFQNKQDSWDAGVGRAPQYRKRMSQVRTFKGHYFKNNRFALKVQGAPVG